MDSQFSSLFHLIHQLKDRMGPPPSHTLLRRLANEIGKPAIIVYFNLVTCQMANSISEGRGAYVN